MLYFWLIPLLLLVLAVVVLSFVSRSRKMSGGHESRLDEARKR